MSKVKTLSQLEQVVSKELSWRKKELHNVKSLLNQHAASYLEPVLLRSAIAVLYAHWEGFIKSVGKAYLEFVSRQKLAHEEMQDCFVALALHQEMSAAEGTRGIESRIRVVDIFRRRMSTRSKIAYENRVSTKSNLSSRVLNNITRMLGLDFSPYETKSKLIDEQLLRNRNSIAHGEYLIVDAEEYNGIHEEILSLIDVFGTQIMNAATQGTYKAAQAMQL